MHRLPHWGRTLKGPLLLSVFPNPTAWTKLDSVLIGPDAKVSPQLPQMDGLFPSGGTEFGYGSFS